MARRLVVEADGASRGNPGPAAFGALVRDGDTDEVIVQVSDTLGVATNNVAEYRALIAGLAAAHALDPEAELEVRMDSRLVVEQMSGRWRVRGEALRELAAAARDLHPETLVRWTWIPRGRNAAADRLANDALDGLTHRPPQRPPSG